MGLLDDYSGPGGLLGIGMSPRPSSQHQIIMSDIETEFNILFRKLGFRALSEQAIQKKPERAPDITFFDMREGNLKPLVFIEITKTRELKSILRESKKLMENLKIDESFTYDYEIGRWYKLYNKDKFPSNKPEDDWSETFQVHLNSFLS